ncbi:MAG TPA: hypothetical protein VK762_01160 [Polyangiaceae bacterium]|nr:hypothetical protein [Polyangiaceae bacterium]
MDEGTGTALGVAEGASGAELAAALADADGSEVSGMAFVVTLRPQATSQSADSAGVAVIMKWWRARHAMERQAGKPPAPR